ncbi:MAG: arginine--tRNA ligase, partial [Nanoarchaeota archaeon]
MATKSEVVKLLSKASGLKESEVSEILEVPPNPELGDYALPCFKLAAKLKKAPQQIANEIKNKISIPKGSSIIEIKNIGPYVNFFLSPENIAKDSISKILKEKENFGKSNLGNGEQVVIDVIGLNPNKAGHIGHIKTGSVGNSIANIYKFLGFKTDTQSFINDQGFPTALTFYAYKYMKDKLPKRTGRLAKEDHWQGEIYTMMKKLAEMDESLKKKVEKLQFDLEHGKDLKLLKEQRAFIERCKSAQAQTWNRFGAGFDLGVHESDITNSGILDETFELLKEKGAVFTSNAPESKGCLLLKLSQFGEFKGMLNPDKILVRSDGRATYTGKDVGLQFWRFGLVPDKMLYVVSSKT